MNRTTKLNEGESFWMGRIECTITKISSFGGTPHYGFYWRTDSGELQSGWMPVDFVENFTGYTLSQKQELGIVDSIILATKMS